VCLQLGEAELAALTATSESLHKFNAFVKALATSGGRTVGIVRLRTEGHGVCFCFFCQGTGFTQDPGPGTRFCLMKDEL
jgi:hypothetical protein